jgi:hypothetical protein
MKETKFIFLYEIAKTLTKYISILIKALDIRKWRMESPHQLKQMRWNYMSQLNALGSLQAMEQ